MARLTRLCVPGELHGLLQRGHNREPVFGDDEDRQAYLDALQAAAQAHAVAIHAYALTDIEVFLLATPGAAHGLGRLMQTVGRRYVAQFNRRHGRSGSLWDGRFRAAPIEALSWFRPALLWVELAPVRAGLAAQPWHWRWSSAAHHAGQLADPRLTDHAEFWRLGNTPFEREAAYRRLSEQSLTSEERERLQRSVEQGWPVGPESFLARLGEQVARPLVPRPRGRPRKAKEGVL